MRRFDWILTVALSALGTAAIWATSARFTGYVEPWDAPSLYYPVALILAGLLAGFLAPPRIWGFFVGAVVGQLIFMGVVAGAGPLVLVGVLVISLYSVLFLIMAALASTVRSTLLRIARGVPPNKSFERTREG
jgi:hypothetical protein